MTTYIGRTAPFGFEGYLVLALSGAWMKVLSSTDFEVEIRNRHLCLKSVGIIKQ